MIFYKKDLFKVYPQKNKKDLGIRVDFQSIYQHSEITHLTTLAMTKSCDKKLEDLLPASAQYFSFLCGLLGFQNLRRRGFQVSFLVLFVFNKACNTKKRVFSSLGKKVQHWGKEFKENKVNVAFLQKGAGFKHELVSDFIKQNFPSLINMVIITSSVSSFL